MHGKRGYLLNTLSSINITSELLSKLPDGKVINEIADKFRDYDENTVCLAIEELLLSEDQNFRKAGLILAKKCLRGKDKILNAIGIGLNRKDVAEIKLWFRNLLPCIGNKSLFNFLNTTIIDDPEKIIMAWYELSHYFRENDTDSLKKLNELRAKLDAMMESMDESDRKYWLSIRE
jgi:hypothetical protein